MLGIDVSHYTAPFTRAALECLKSQGCEFVIIGTQDHTKFVLHAKDAIAAGLKVEWYIYLYAAHPANPSISAPEQVSWTIQKIKEANLPLSFIWLDVESGFESGSIADNEQRLRECVDLCTRAGVPCGIYTGGWYWVPKMGNSQAFKHLPLWYAHYNGQPNFNNFVSFGGWTKPNTKQYMGTNDWCGVNNDRNYREVHPAPEGRSDTLILADLWNEYIGLAYEMGWVNSVLSTRPETAVASRVLAMDELFHEAGLR